MSDLVSQNLNMIFKTPKGEIVHALKDLNFTLKKGELLTVLGPSGCGKTTLLNIAAGFLRPTSGSINLGGNEINGFCFTPQDGNSLLSSLSATLWFLYPHSYKDKLNFLSNLFFDHI